MATTIAPAPAAAPTTEADVEYVWRFGDVVFDEGRWELRLAGQPRVFRFAYSGCRMAALKREATLTRVLTQLLGPHPGVITLHEWNFEETPYFLECAYGGLNWLEWAEAGHLAPLGREQRLGLML